MRKYLIGFLCGLIMVFAFAVLAAELNVTLNPFLIMVDGEQRDIEAYNINGFTYLKLADVAKATSNIIDVKFNEVKERIEINTAAIVTPAPIPLETPPPRATPKPTPRAMPTPQFYTEEITVDKSINESGKTTLNFMEIDGIKYITIGSAGVLAMIEDSDIVPKWDDSIPAFYLKNKNTDINISGNIPFKMLNSRGYIDYLYFQNTILPIVIKESGN